MSVMALMTADFWIIDDNVIRGESEPLLIYSNDNADLASGDKG